MKNKGFASMTIVYSFLLVFLLTLVSLLALYTEKSRYVDSIVGEAKEALGGTSLGSPAERNFVYTGNYEEYIAPYTGYYRLEAWGAQGGYRTNIEMGGKGGYATGVLRLEKNQKIYVYVGGSGNSGGFNGGGSRATYAGGGGATDIRLNIGDLYSRIIVAGGGGSDGAATKSGGYGGGATGGMISTGGCGTFNVAGTFGVGGNGINVNGGYGGAGGGGWNGGLGVTPDGSGDDDYGGAGGSAFAYTSAYSLPDNYHINPSYSMTEISLIGGNASMPDPQGTTMTGKIGNGYARITPIQRIDVVVPDDTTNFKYTGNYQEFVAPKSGEYKLEVWGAQGGYRNIQNLGGAGGYSTGVVNLKKDDKIYVYVGGSGNSGGFNGGGSRTTYAGGGGATDIRIVQGDLYSRIIVAGGGGSVGSIAKDGGYGGGTTGGIVNSGCCGTLNVNGTFGVGGTGVSVSGGFGGAGGGGWYGGMGVTPDGSGDDDLGGSGGTGFVLIESGSAIVPANYNVERDYYLKETNMIAGNASMPNPEGGTMTGNRGDGYARITLVQEIVYTPIEYVNFSYTGSYQEYIIPYKGRYKLEVWGASGGYRTNIEMGGKGGYATGIVNLQENEKIYLYLGGTGNSGGFNGGGTRPTYKGGGGATDIRLTVGDLYSRIIVAGGGGSDGAATKVGGYGGGATGGMISTGGCGTFNVAGTFGVGGNGINVNGGYGGAGGGGWYGGTGVTPDGSGDDDYGGGGGSAFVYTSSSTVPPLYNVNSSYQMTNATMISGNAPTPILKAGYLAVGQTGHGMAKITLIEKLQ